MTKRIAALAAAAAAAFFTPSILPAAELILTTGRTAYYASEPIELAVSGADADVSIQIAPKFEGAGPVELTYAKGTTAIVLPPYTLATGEYIFKLDGADTGVSLKVTSGLRTSEMLVSQTDAWTKIVPGGANFIVGNSFSWTRLDGGGVPAADPRSKRSSGWNMYERAIAEDLPTVCYMYWTGYVTHKPFGSHKSWAADDMTEALRLLNFSNAQWMRHFKANIVKVGTLDEPGLAWGKTPAGGSASGFPNWDEQQWYESRGAKFTQDIGSLSDEDYIKYITVRCEIMKEQNAQAKADLKTIWPDMVFATDLYALHAIMDGTEALNQQVNDIPTSHVFSDWGIGRAGMYSGILLEKCHDPTAPFAHAMNGQLFEETVPQPNQTDAYRASLNSMLMAGLYSNWWLNMRGMDPETLNSVNEPAKRIGSIFHHVAAKESDVAVVWGFTELAMRQKEIARQEATKKGGEQIKLMVASMPETHEEGGIVVNAYSIGQDYKDQVLGTHMAINRAGYPAHILHERLLPERAKNYKTLVIVGQTFEFPAEIRKAIEDFQAAGGKVIVDRQTKIQIKDAIVHEGDFADIGFKWGHAFQEGSSKDTKLSPREASKLLTNWFMDEPQRVASPKLEEALKKTDSQQVLETDTVHLLAERHVGGEGALYMVLNANDELPEIPEDQRHVLYNYASLQATYTLKGIPEGAQVWVIEGTDWKKVSKLENPSAPITASFAPGEMKLYLVSPTDPGELKVTAAREGGSVKVSASIGAKVPWPITVSLIGPDGQTLKSVYRAIGEEGTYEETLPVGINALAGAYTVRVESPVALKPAEAKVEIAAQQPQVAAITDAARIFDEEAIRSFLTEKPAVVIAIGNDAQQAAADKLAAALKAKGIDAQVKPEAEAYSKALYPRVFNPYARQYTPGGEEQQPQGEVTQNLTLARDADGVVTITDADGKKVTDWRQPNTVITIAGEGYIDASGDFEIVYLPGVKLYLNDKRAITVLNATMQEVKTDESFRAKWRKPWHSLTSYVGGYQFPPQLPHAYQTEHHLILLGDSTSGTLVRALQASEVLPQVVDAKYPGPGKSLVQFAWSPFGVEKNVIYIGAVDEAGLNAGIDAVTKLLP